MTERRVTQVVPEVSGQQSAIQRRVTQVVVEVAFTSFAPVGTAPDQPPLSHRGWRTMPKVFFTIDGIAVDAEPDWTLRASAFGGYETGGFKIPGRQLRRHPFGITAAAPVAAFTAGDEQIWEGTIPTDPRVGEDGKAEISTEGPWVEAVRAAEVRCFQVRGGRRFVEGDSDPHNYANNDAFETERSGGKLQYKAPKGEDFTAGDVASFVVWIPGVHFTRYAFIINKSGDNSNFDIRVRGAQGPSGALTDIDTYTLGAANPSGTEKIKTGLGGDYDLLNFQIRCATTVANLGTRLRAWLTSIRANDLALDDDMSASDVVKDIGEALGWNVDGVIGTSANVLPLLWTEPWSELLLYMADLEDNYVRRVARGLEYASWGEQRWEILRSFSARPELRALEPFNRVVVHYETIAGAPAQVTADPDVDPLPGRLRVLDYDLADPQPNATLAQAVADRMIARYAAPRYAGRVEVHRTRHQSGPLAMVPGDVADVADWDLGVSVPLRIHGTEYRHDHTVLSIESPISLVQLLEEARRGLGHPRRRGRNRRA